MDVRCERCNAQYAVDDGLVHDAGLAVRCAMCGHSFKVMKSHGWSLRKTTGDVYPLPDSATLQRWVVEGRVTRDDDVAEPGHAWAKAGSLKDLEPFFAVVDQARRARVTPHGTPLPALHEPPRDPRTETGELVLGTPMAPTSDGWEVPRPARIHSNEPAWASGPSAGHAEAPVQKVAVASAKEKVEPKGRGWPVLLFLFVVLVILGLAMGATFYFLRPDLLPPEFNKFIQDWNRWTSGSEKLSKDGASRALAPVMPGARPGGGTNKPPAPLVPLPPSSSSPSAPPPARAPDAPAPAPPPAAGEAAPPAAPAPPANVPAAPAASAATSPTNGESAAAPVPPETAEAPKPAPPPEISAPAAPSEKLAVLKKPPAEKKADPASKSKALLEQARSLRDRGRSSAALDVYARAIQLNPNSAEALAGRGLAYLDLSRYRQAEESFKGSLAINGSHPAALMGLAETYRYEGKRSDAVTYYRKYLAAHPKGEDATAAHKAIQSLEESP